MGIRSTKPAPVPPALDDDDDDVSWNNDEPEDDSLDDVSCMFCGCTKNKACDTPDGPCYWISLVPSVCSAPSCAAAHARGAGLRMAELAAGDGTPGVTADPVDEPNPPIAEREATGRDTEIGADAETLGSSVAERTAAAPIGVAANLPGSPTVTGLVVELSIDDIQPDPDQPRLDVDVDLADSIAAHGVLQPIVVRPHPEYSGAVGAENLGLPRYMIVDGERRWKAANTAGLAKIPARVDDSTRDDGDRLLQQVVFNDGKRLAPMEEAKAWKRILDAKHWNVAELARALGRPKSTVSDRFAMLDAAPGFQPMFLDGSLSAAAAPVVRQYSALPEAVVNRLIDAASKDYGWRQHLERGKTIPIADVKNTLERALSYTFVLADSAVDFTGETFEIDGKRYVIDRDAYHRAEALHRRDVAKMGGDSKTNAKADWQIRQAEDDRKRRAAKDRSDGLKRAQITAVNSKLPTELSGAWALAVIDYMLMSGNARDVLPLIAVAMPAKKTQSGVNFDKLVRAHAERLDTKGRHRLILQIMLADEMNSYGGGQTFLKTAAMLTRVDLKKVKPADPDDTAPATKAPAKKVTVKKAVAKKSAVRRTMVVTFMQPQQPDAALAMIIGAKPMPRTEVTKKIWAYIKKNGLQDKKDRRMITADAKLKPVFGKAKVSLFEMTKILNKHLKPVTPAKAAGARK